MTMMCQVERHIIASIPFYPSVLRLRASSLHDPMVPRNSLLRFPVFAIITCAISDFPQSCSRRAGTATLERSVVCKNSFLFFYEFRKDLKFLFPPF